MSEKKMSRKGSKFLDHVSTTHDFGVFVKALNGL